MPDLHGVSRKLYTSIEIDSNNCKDADSGPFNFVNPTIMQIALDKVDPTCYNDDGTITISGLDASATGLYNYILNGGAQVPFNPEVQKRSKRKKNHGASSIYTMSSLVMTQNFAYQS